jgi:electron transfer flavoprotein beta subunit
LTLPALLTCQLGLNTPRYPTLPNIMRSKRAAIEVLSSEDTGLTAPLTSGAGFARHERSASCTVLEGEVNGLADEVLEVLGRKTAVLRRGGAG